ncbi:unnamed protein product [Phytophthora fragariaefolia]|uniref:Unnamed protein product n=1 Tax=Phytophthora fragariaefolia TaxID=1490495 RepID=A0A9W6XYC6_9STRA|nr:unnamed protein product [Phytophthora fragariaefolia]
MRAKCLSSVDDQRKPTKEDMEDVLDGTEKMMSTSWFLRAQRCLPVRVALRGALSDEPEVFPLDLTRAKTRGSVKKEKEVDEIDEGAAAELVDATSQVAVMRAAGATYLDIRITKIGLKDASVYVNPSMAVSVFGELARARTLKGIH